MRFVSRDFLIYFLIFFCCYGYIFGISTKLIVNETCGGKRKWTIPLGESRKIICSKNFASFDRSSFTEEFMSCGCDLD